VATWLLARAHGARGAAGLRRFALARLATRHADATIEADGRTATGRELAEKAREAAPSPAPRPGLQPPLREVAIERVGDEEFPRAVAVAAEPDDPCPIGLLGNGPLLVGVDLAKGAVAFRVTVGTGARAAWSGGVLVVSVQGAIRGHAPSDGRTLWEVPIEGFTPQLDTTRGLVFAVVRASNAGSGRRLLAIDPSKGEVVWRADLGTVEVTMLLADGDVLLERLRTGGSAGETLVEVRDGLTGGEREPIRLPSGRVDREIVPAGPDLLVTSRDAKGMRSVAATTVATGRPRWRRPLGVGNAPCDIVIDGDRAWLLHPDGRLLAISLATGDTVSETRLYAGEGVHACPYPGTKALLHEGRILFVPWVSGREPTTRALAYDLRTGRLAFESRFPAGRQPTKVTFQRSGSVLVFALVYQVGTRGMTIRLIDAATGAKVQEIEPSEASEDWVPTLVEGYGTLLLYGRSGVRIFAGGAAAASPK
jgi:outer membrane protein assembly factor BamB